MQTWRGKTFEYLLLKIFHCSAYCQPYCFPADAIGDKSIFVGHKIAFNQILINEHTNLETQKGA